ncbi:hypothetical protein [Listeria fleischmannii]|uniref:Uncharacterized protein n=1 Tax=Listeria fleischmannii FSL S10-1203 TaxID=1265822 RepID=W7DCM1_9LIST|nr:hypothetical protein [Listeria fleischmannii]EUJ47032.1 hypothetical protein MCOL2_18564 [Listeria fleischmannii FSL S10-1203]
MNREGEGEIKAFTLPVFYGNEKIGVRKDSLFGERADNYVRVHQINFR